jgi:hypothetical protein
MAFPKSRFRSSQYQNAGIEAVSPDMIFEWSLAVPLLLRFSRRSSPARFAPRLRAK